MKLYFFSSGYLESYRDLFIVNGGHTTFNVPVPYFLIQHKGKNILFDTGNHKDDMNGHLSERLLSNVRPVFTEDEWAPKAIEKVGLKPEDIDFVIMSHLHHDHAGAITEFPNATVIIQKSEYDYAHRPDYFMTQAYYPDEFPQDVNWYFLDGWNDNKFDLFNDGKIIIYFTPGHAYGHQSLLVDTDKDGSFLFTADACYVQENIDKGILPGLVCDCPAYLQNLKTFKLLEKQGVQIVTGHDPEKWETFKHAPEYYE